MHTLKYFFTMPYSVQAVVVAAQVGMPGTWAGCSKTYLIRPAKSHLKISSVPMPTWSTWTSWLPRRPRKVSLLPTHLEIACLWFGQEDSWTPFPQLVIEQRQEKKDRSKDSRELNCFCFWFFLVEGDLKAECVVGQNALSQFPDGGISLLIIMFCMTQVVH